MFQQLTRFAAATQCALSLVTLAASSAHAQSQPKPIVTARAADEVYVDVIIDNSEGTSINSEMSKSYAAQIAGSQWQVLDNGQLLVTKDSKPLFGALAFSNQKQTWFLIHARTPKMVVDGEMYRYGDKPEEGWANLWVSMPSADGKSFATVRMGVPLSFGAQNGSPDPGGFGGFGN
jgi:hypothetical protein